MFGIDPRSYPSCSSYDSAAHIWSEAKDCSDKDVWGVNSRPLDSVRMRHKAITKHADDSFSFDLYQTEMVRYYPDGTVGGTTDNRLSSIHFFGNLSPSGMWLGNVDSHTFIMFDDKDDVRNYVVPENGTFKLKCDGTQRQWQLLTPAVQRTRMVPDRKAINAVSKAFKPFYEWVAAAEKVTGHSVIGPGRYLLDGITMPPTVDQYGRLAECSSTLDNLKLRINEHFGAYSRVDIPNTERPRRSKLGRWQDT